LAGLTPKTRDLVRTKLTATATVLKERATELEAKLSRPDVIQSKLAQLEQERQRLVAELAQAQRDAV